VKRNTPKGVSVLKHTYKGVVEHPYFYSVGGAPSTGSPFAIKCPKLIIIIKK